MLIRLGHVGRQKQLATIDDEIDSPFNEGRFQIRCGREIVVDPMPGANPCVLGALLQGRMMAHLLRQRGYLPLHASGIAIEGRGVLFVGESGAGKSTTAAAFYSRGHSVLTDDVAALRIVDRRVEMRTPWRGLRLLDDARNVIHQKASPTSFRVDKHVYNLESPDCASSLFDLKRIYILDFGTADCAPSLRTSVIRRASAVALLNSHSFLRPRRIANELLQINLARSASIVAVVPVHRLFRPRSLCSLPELVDFVEKEVTTNE